MRAGAKPGAADAKVEPGARLPRDEAEGSTKKEAIMSKARARARKKARLTAAHAALSAPKEVHETGVDHTPADQVEDKSHTGKFDAKAPPGGGLKNTSGKGAPNLAASTRGSARSR
jgi:hypothetical protein